MRIDEALAEQIRTEVVRARNEVARLADDAEAACLPPAIMARCLVALEGCRAILQQQLDLAAGHDLPGLAWPYPFPEQSEDPVTPLPW